ncbi:MAG: nucleotidyltransferase domain-containing protein [Sulfolobales archaeon]
MGEECCRLLKTSTVDWLRGLGGIVNYLKSLLRIYVSGLVEEVYLVGSRARGDHVESSDFDVVVIIKDDEDPLDIAMRVRLLKKSSIPLDVIVLRVGESKDPIYVEMLRYARKLC